MLNSAYYEAAGPALAAVRAAVAGQLAARGSWQISDLVDEAGQQYVDLVMEGGGASGRFRAGFTLDTGLLLALSH